MGVKNKSSRKIWKWALPVISLMVVIVVTLGYLRSDSPVSYLPDKEYRKADKLDNKQIAAELMNSWYKLIIDNTGKVMIKDTDNNKIVTCLSYHAEYEAYGHHNLTDVKVWQETDSTAIIEGGVNEKSRVKIIVTVPVNDPRANFNVITCYLDSVTVTREAFLVYLNAPVTEVYKKNRKIDTGRFHREYWLDKEGLKVGEGYRSLMIYQPREISSLQLDTHGKMVVINLESQFDHPFIQVPFQEDGGDRWINRSAAAYEEGDDRTNYFSIILGKVPDLVPRLMLVPDGYLAGYVFTEHADSADIRSHRAAYFGSEKITDISKAKGGFAGHSIPVTKSVFYEEFDNGTSDSTDTVALIEREYADFLDQLYSTGLYDLCLHTPEEGNSEREYLEEAINSMKEKYNSITWIDHGFFHGNSNRESLVADGLNPSSPYYAADLWDKYGTRYFWSPAVEAVRFSEPGMSVRDELMHMRLVTLSTEFWKRYDYRKNYLGESSLIAFERILHGNFPTIELNSMQPFRSSALPTPLYWQNLTITDRFYSWTTEYVYNGMPSYNPDEWLSVEKRGLDKLVLDWGIFINHGYYVRNIPENKSLSQVNGELVINPDFDEILAYMDILRDKGDLLITTIKDIMNYWLLLENISFNYKADGSIEISNENDTSIKGLSLAIRTRSENIRLDDEIPSSRLCGDDTIIWFDIPARGKRTMTF